MPWYIWIIGVLIIALFCQYIWLKVFQNQKLQDDIDRLQGENDILDISLKNALKKSETIREKRINEHKKNSDLTDVDDIANRWGAQP